MSGSLPLQAALRPAIFWDGSSGQFVPQSASNLLVVAHRLRHAVASIAAVPAATDIPCSFYTDEASLQRLLHSSGATRAELERVINQLGGTLVVSPQTRRERAADNLPPARCLQHLAGSESRSS